MNGRIARAIRKELKFNPNDEREYVEHELTRMRQIMSYNHEKNRVDIVKRPVSVFITECTTGKRSIYQFMKRKYVNPDYEMALNELPSVDELAKVARDIISDKEVVEEVKEKNKTEKELTALGSSVNENAAKLQEE